MLVLELFCVVYITVRVICFSETRTEVCALTFMNEGYNGVS